MSSVSGLVQLGHDNTSVKYYWVALTTILFYDYLLTLPDEVQYAWKGKRSWVFAIFLLNRYLPMVFTIWVLVADYSWGYTYEMCSKTAFLKILCVILCTLIAQIILNARLYAITMRSKIITGFFVALTIPQFGLGLYLATLAANTPAEQFPPIPLPAYHLCLFTRHQKEELAHTAFTLAYDFLAFLVIVVLGIKSSTRGYKMPYILRIIVQDATAYFLVIFTSHLILEITMLSVRPSLQLLPASGNTIYLPVMIGRLMLSLKKAASTKEIGWTLKSITHTPYPEHHVPKCGDGLKFAPVPGGADLSIEESFYLRDRSVRDVHVGTGKLERAETVLP